MLWLANFIFFSLFFVILFAKALGGELIGRNLKFVVPIPHISTTGYTLYLLFKLFGIRVRIDSR